MYKNGGRKSTTIVAAFWLLIMTIHTSYNDYEIVASSLLEDDQRRVATASQPTPCTSAAGQSRND